MTHETGTDTTETEETQTEVNEHLTESGEEEDSHHEGEPDVTENDIDNEIEGYMPKVPVVHVYKYEDEHETPPHVPEVEERRPHPDQDRHESSENGGYDEDDDEENEVDGHLHEHTTPHYIHTSTHAVDTHTDDHDDDDDSTSDIEDVVYKEYEETGGSQEETEAERELSPSVHETDETGNDLVHHVVEHVDRENEIDSETSKIICDDGLKLDDFGKCVGKCLCL